MKLFACQHCGQLLDFENTHCERCDRALGYLPDLTELSALELVGEDRYRPLAVPERTVRYCANATYEVCNWLVDEASDAAMCAACRHNRMIPDLSEPENLLRWRRIESAKHRLFYGLMRLRVPLVSRAEDPAGLTFDFLAASGSGSVDGEQVLTGHRAGVITINVAEADDVERERQRQEFAEPYRTLLGHFRHETGHYYWDQLVQGGPWLERARELVGDDEADYGASLERHHTSGPPPDWSGQYVTSYATAHPLEDWAESWAHYLHMLDALETAWAFGIEVGPTLGDGVHVDPYGPVDFDALVGAWLPLTHALNSLSRSVGQRDLYPFVLPPPVLEKLRLVHDVAREWSAGASG